MTDPAGSDQLQQDIPTESGTGDVGPLERADPDGSGQSQGGEER